MVRPTRHGIAAQFFALRPLNSCVFLLQEVDEFPGGWFHGHLRISLLGLLFSLQDKVSRSNKGIFKPLLYVFRMYGLFQTAFYFGYMALFSLAMGLMCGKHPLPQKRNANDSQVSKSHDG